jgi:hypothetical protein
MTQAVTNQAKLGQFPIPSQAVMSLLQSRGAASAATYNSSIAALRKGKAFPQVRRRSRASQSKSGEM